ncbi:hypothetical protein ARMGADRAFT_1041114, partial [Armillaria gallica]
FASAEFKAKHLTFFAQDIVADESRARIVEITAGRYEFTRKAGVAVRDVITILDFTNGLTELTFRLARPDEQGCVADGIALADVRILGECKVGQHCFGVYLTLYIPGPESILVECRFVSVSVLHRTRKYKTRGGRENYISSPLAEFRRMAPVASELVPWPGYVYEQIRKYDVRTALMSLATAAGIWMTIRSNAAMYFGYNLPEILEETSEI